MIIGSTIAEHAAARPGDVALVFDRQVFTWGKLETLLKKAASWIDRVSPEGKSIALNLPNCPALAIFFLAGARTGREVQILDTQWPRAHTQEIIARLSPDLIVATERDGIAGHVQLISKDALNFSGMETWLSQQTPLAVWRVADDLSSFYVGFTSGSTGLPKGYRRNHRSWIASFDVAREEFDLTSGDIVAAPGTMTHSLYLFAFAWAMHEGAACLMSRTFKPTAVVEAARLHRASVMFGVPAQLGMLSRHLQEYQEPCLPDLRWLISSGSKWSSREDPVLRAHACNAHFAEFYGASETSFISLSRDGEPVLKDSVGRAFRGVRIGIRDENGSLCDYDVDGRIFVTSDMLFDGYATGADDAEHLEDGSICVGDIGHLDENGYLFLTGRKNRMIVTSGRNVFPEEVERVLEQHAAVQSAAVIAIADEKRGERLVGILSLRDGVSLNRADIIAHARKHLPLFKTPRAYFLVKNWPATRSGKSDFVALRQMLERGTSEKLP